MTSDPLSEQAENVSERPLTPVGTPLKTPYGPAVAGDEYGDGNQKVHYTHGARWRGNSIEGTTGAFPRASVREWADRAEEEVAP